MANLSDTFGEYWDKEVVKILFPNNTFMSKFKDVSGKVTGGRILNIPYADNTVGITKNGFGGTPTFAANQNVQSNITMELDSYRVDPQTVEDVVENWTKFGKLDIDTEMALEQLGKHVANDTLYKIYGEIDAANLITTSGDAGIANDPLGGNKKMITKNDIIKLAAEMGKQDVPRDKRYLLLNEEMYSELLKDTTIGSADAFGATVSIDGIVNRVAGINIIVRSNTGTESTAGIVSDLNSPESTDDSFVGLAWSEGNYVYSAKGSTKVFSKVDDPMFYGTIFSSEVYADAVLPRPIGKRIGVFKITQG